MIKGKLVPEKSKSWSLVLLSCVDLVKYLGSITTILKNCSVPLVATQQPLPSYLACSSYAAGLAVLEAPCDVSRGRNKLQVVLHNLPSHVAAPHLGRDGSGGPCSLPPEPGLWDVAVRNGSAGTEKWAQSFSVPS